MRVEGKPELSLTDVFWRFVGLEGIVHVGHARIPLSNKFLNHACASWLIRVL